MTTTYLFRAGYTKLGVAVAPSSAPTITVVDSANNLLESAQATTLLSNLVGAYIYSYSGTDGLYLQALFHTTDATVDQQDLFSMPVNYAPSTAVGSNSKTVKVTDNSSNPLDGVLMWVTTDSGGTNKVASGFTDEFGNVTFTLDTGTYYFWKQLAGYTFTNPQSDTVP